VRLGERLAGEIEAVVYFTIAEALTNVSKHSGATKCDVFVECANESLVARVVDNGRGGATNGGELGQGGLAGMTARVRSAGGSLTIDSPTGGPTVLTMELPCAS
jgi:signal transduction histidine kinase